MFRFGRTSAKVLVTVLAAGTIASAKTGKIDVNCDGKSDIPLIKLGSDWSSIPTMMSFAGSVYYKNIVFREAGYFLG